MKNDLTIGFLCNSWASLTTKVASTHNIAQMYNSSIKTTT